MLVGLVSGLVFGLGGGLLSGLRVGLRLWVLFGLLSGLLFGLRFGGRACLHHFALRLVLWHNNFAPLQLHSLPRLCDGSYFSSQSWWWIRLRTPHVARVFRSQASNVC